MFNLFKKKKNNNEETITGESKVIIYKGEDFDNEVLEDNITLVDFYAEWCGPCKMLNPVLDNLSKVSNYKIVKIDTDEYSDLPQKYKVRSLPTIIIFKNKEEVDRISGFVEKKEIEKVVSKYL